MAGKLRDTLSRRYRNRRPQHEQTRSARARGPPVRAGFLASLEVRRYGSRSVAVRTPSEVSMQTTTHG